MDKSSLASAFMGLFEGAIRSHGTYNEEEEEEGGKRTIKKSAKTVKEPITLKMWEQHLAGTRPLGVVPIREDNCCLWGAIDVDVYPIDHKEIVNLLESSNIPAIVCKTKSGGAHIFLFFSEPIPAEMLVPRLRDLAAFVSHAESEIFPKQIKVLIERGDFGSWLNMPYYGEDKTERYAVGSNGRGLSAESFLTRVQVCRLDRKSLKDLELRRVVVGFETGPPCIESLIQTGFPPHTRNNGILALGTLAKKIQPGGWETLLEGWVKQYGGEPAFPASELSSIIRGLKKKDYNYRCSDTPLCERCNSTVCRTRKHGVGAGSDIGAVSPISSVSVQNSDPPVWIVILKDGNSVVIEHTKDFLDPYQFRKIYCDQILSYFPLYKGNDWEKHVKLAMENKQIIDVPKETSPVGHFKEILTQFITNKTRAENKDEILLDKPWHNEEEGTIWLTIKMIQDALLREKFTCPSGNLAIRSWISRQFRELGGKSDKKRLKGGIKHLWILPAEQFNFEDQEVPLRKLEDDSPL